MRFFMGRPIVVASNSCNLGYTPIWSHLRLSLPTANCSAIRLPAPRVAPVWISLCAGGIFTSVLASRSATVGM